jgi:hypothetical protein
MGWDGKEEEEFSLFWKKSFVKSDQTRQNNEFRFSGDPFAKTRKKTGGNKRDTAQARKTAATVCGVCGVCLFCCNATTAASTAGVCSTSNRRRFTRTIAKCR